MEEGLDEGRWVDRPRPTELPTILSNCFTLQATANSNFEGLEGPTPSAWLQLVALPAAKSPRHTGDECAD